MGDIDSIILKRAGELAALKIKKPAVYFAHPLNSFDTPLESVLIKKISEKIPNYFLYNPNQEENQRNYQLWKEKTGNGMNYYFDFILPHMAAGVFLPFEDEMIGAGVFGEAEFLYRGGRPVWEIDNAGKISLIMRLDYSRRLSIEETRRRIYGRKE